jgi:predicted nucleotidyltransferase
MVEAATILRDNPGLTGFLRELLHSFPQIRQVYLFGSRVRGVARADSDWDILVYGGYDDAMNLMRGLARAQGDEDLKSGEELIDLYVETEGPALIAVWSTGVPRVLPEEIRKWQDGEDYMLLLGDPNLPQLGARAKWRREYSV